MSTLRIKILQPVTVSQPDPSKSYKQMIITHLDLATGKPDGKKIIDIFAKGVWGTFLNAKEGEVYEVQREKNAKGYWEWQSVTLSAAESTDAAPQTATSLTARAPTTPKTERIGSWETSEERAAKQVYIVRQSSISAAIAFGKAKTVEDVLATAKQFEDYVFGASFNDQPE